MMLMDCHLKIKAIEGAYIALDAIKRAEERRKRALTELHMLAGFIDPENQSAVIVQLRELHELGIPLAEAQKTMLGVESKVAAFRKKAERTARGDRDSLLSRVGRDYPERDTGPFARTRAATTVAETASVKGSLDKLVPGDPDSDFSLRRPTAGS